MKALLTLCSLLCVVSGNTPEELTPRAYWPAPQGAQVLTIGIMQTDGDIVPDPSLALYGFDKRQRRGL